MKNFLLAMFLLLFSVVIGFFLPHHYPRTTKNPSGEQILEQASYNTIQEALVNKPECTAMNAVELGQANQTLGILKTFPEISKMHIAAIQYFGTNQYRYAPNSKALLLCIPQDIKAAVATEVLKEGLFSRKVAEPDLLRLAFMLESEDPEIINAVGNTAFYHEGVYYSTGDARPLARLVLAEFGLRGQQWSNQAFAEMSDKDALGTSASTVAIATDHPQAVERVAQFIAGILSENTGVIKMENVGRLISLTEAMALAGDKAQPFIDPLIDLSSRKIESFAPPFGIIEVSPKFLCHPLELIGGRKAEEIFKGPLCSSDKSAN